MDIKKYNLRTRKSGPFYTLNFSYVKMNFIFRYLYEVDTMDEAHILTVDLMLTILKENIKTLSYLYDKNIFVYDLESDNLEFKNDIIPFTEKVEQLKNALKPFNNNVNFTVSKHRGMDRERFTSDTLNNEEKNN
jgi:hypothetical protein